ncbi:MAG: polyhydroxyalkanoate synthesis regulator DNA-binding domain-containing protein [Pirellulaceae bacterium]
MPAPVQISRYPNRRFYDRQSSKYISLGEIEQMVQAGQTVEIRDNQTGEDLTRSVLTRIIMDRQPEKMQLFPIDMLHFIVRSNTMMTEFLQDYFRHSLTYLEYLQRHGNAATRLGTPMHWMKAWIDRIVPRGPAAMDSPTADSNGDDSSGDDRSGDDRSGDAEPSEDVSAEAITGESRERALDEDRAEQLARRVEQLEERIRKMEAVESSSKST